MMKNTFLHHKFKWYLDHTHNGLELRNDANSILKISDHRTFPNTDCGEDREYRKIPEDTFEFVFGGQDTAISKVRIFIYLGISKASKGSWLNPKSQNENFNGLST